MLSEVWRLTVKPVRMTRKRGSASVGGGTGWRISFLLFGSVWPNAAATHSSSSSAAPPVIFLNLITRLLICLAPSGRPGLESLFLPGEEFANIGPILLRASGACLQHPLNIF